MAISETKITKNALYLNINLHGYSFLHGDSETKTGGVTFYIEESVLFSRMNNIKVGLPLVEDMWIEAEAKRGLVVIGVVYRHQTNSTSNCENFCELNFEKFLFYVLGVFNIDLNKVGKSNFVTINVHNMTSLLCKCAVDLCTRSPITLKQRQTF